MFLRNVVTLLGVFDSPVTKSMCFCSAAELRATDRKTTGMDGVSTISVLEPYHARGMFRVSPNGAITCGAKCFNHMSGAK